MRGTNEIQNRFKSSLDRIKKYVEPQDDWSEEDWRHYRTVLEALQFCADLTNNA